MKYPYVCDDDRISVEIERSIHADVEEVFCPICKKALRRIYGPLPVHFHSQGFHKTDYDKHGDKLERLNKNWSEYYGEAPPPPAKEVPRNSSEPW